VIRLWDGPAPNTPENAPEEVTGSDERVRNVSVPTLTAYLPDKARASGTAIIVCSGGGYNQLAVKRHGENAAAAILPRGIAVFSLKYRLRPISKDVVADAMADGERAVRLVRSRAGEWNLDPNRIGIIGYSAGANLILNLLSNFDDGTPTSADAIERESSRPDFAGLFAAWPGSQKIGAFHFSKKTPPVFLAHTEDDTTAKVTFAREIEAELKRAGAQVNAEYFPADGHTAFTIGGGAHGDWPQRFLPWLTAMKVLPAP
jgi:endo-1,4-beta-xylanase